MRPTAVLNVVGLSESLMGANAPHLSALAARGFVARLRPALPAVTCTVQSSMLTGRPPSEHGVVGNGWYDRTLAEVLFWKQSNHLVQAEKVWDVARRRDPSFTVANMFWWYNMYAAVDYSVTPRPIYKADGRKIPDVYSDPPELRGRLQAELGQFPLFHFWGPLAGIKSTEWIAAASRLVYETYEPSLTLVYLPHLDYGLQRLGPDQAEIADHVTAVDRVVGELVAFFDAHGVRPLVVSEYGIEGVDGAVAINRVLRENGYVRVREEQGLELLDPGASKAFAVADHQVAHVYVAERDHVPGVAALCGELPGVGDVLDRGAQQAVGIAHPRAGDLVLVASERQWFTYDYWLEEERAPDFARTVDIHRKPGYDPRELFIDPGLSLAKARVGAKVLRSRLGMRTLMDVIPLDTTLVRGSHGRTDVAPGHQPVLISPEDVDGDELPCEAVHDHILDCLFSG